MFKFFNDNIGYVLLEPQTKHLIAVDMGEFEVSSKIINELEKKHQTQLRYILSTHKHHDHIGGNIEWKEEMEKRG